MERKESSVVAIMAPIPGPSSLRRDPSRQRDSRWLEGTKYCDM